MNNKVLKTLTVCVLLGLTSTVFSEIPESSLFIIYDDARQEEAFESPEVQGFQLQAASNNTDTRIGARQDVYSAIQQAFRRDKQAAGEAVQAALQSAGPEAEQIEVPWFSGEVVQASAQDIDRCVNELKKTDAVKNKSVRYIRFERQKYLQPLQPLVVKPTPTAAGSQSVQWGVAKIRANEVWSNSTGKGVKVAVIDSGIDHTHPLFKSGQVIMKGRNNLVTAGSPPTDDRVIAGVGGGHGSHVAGIIAGQDGYGVAPDATLISIKVFDNQGRTVASNFFISVDRAIEAGADVINMSFASPHTGRNDDQKKLWDKRIQRAVDENIVVVAASANAPTFRDIGLPGGVDAVITVAATNSQDKISNGSIPLSSSRSFPSKPDVAAPGGNWNGGAPEGVPSAKAHTQGEMSMPGTSMAAPHVAGICALIKEDGPSLSPAKIKELIKETAVDLGNTQRAGAGRVDALAAYNEAFDGGGGGNEEEDRRDFGSGGGNSTERSKAHEKQMTQLREIRDYWRERNGRSSASSPHPPAKEPEPRSETLTTLTEILNDQRIFNAQTALDAVMREHRQLTDQLEALEDEYNRAESSRGALSNKINELDMNLEEEVERHLAETEKETLDANKVKELAKSVRLLKKELNALVDIGYQRDEDFAALDDKLEQLKVRLEVVDERKEYFESKLKKAEEMAKTLSN